MIHFLPITIIYYKLTMPSSGNTLRVPHSLQGDLLDLLKRPRGWGDLTVKDVKDKLEELGLSSKGTHKVLCERLLEHLQGKSQNPVKGVIVKKRTQTPKQTPKTGKCKLWVSGITTMCPECKKLSLNKLQVHVYGGDYICEICDQEVNYMWHCNRRGCKGKAKYASDDDE